MCQWFAFKVNIHLQTRMRLQELWFEISNMGLSFSSLWFWNKSLSSYIYVNRVLKLRLFWRAGFYFLELQPQIYLVGQQNSVGGIMYTYSTLPFVHSTLKYYWHPNSHHKVELEGSWWYKKTDSSKGAWMV